MARRPATFKQTDIVRAVKAARAAGLNVAGFELALDGRTIKIVERSENEVARSPFDQWKVNRDARQAQRT
jgi:hypothetical protein